MTTKDQLVEQHIREYEARLKHLNELFARAHEASAGLDDGHAITSELGEYQKQRSELVNQASNLKKMPLAHWREETIQSAGPMAVFDILAQKIEDLIERAER